MAALDFPASPTVGQQATLTNGFTYQWDGAVWTLAAATGQQAGGDLTGTYPNPTLTAAAKSKWSAGTTLTPLGTFANLLTVDTSGQLTVGASTTAGKLLLAPQCTLAATVGATTNVDLTCNTDATVPSYNQAANGYILRLGAGGGNDWVQIIRRAAGTTTLTQIANFDGASNMQIAGATATKASGTTWANPSDPRLKRDIAPYATGLDAITRLDPITFKYNGLGGTTDDDRLCYGLDASAVRDVMPDCVGTRLGKLRPDDDADTEMLTLDASNITWALVNAVKELAARLAALET